MPVAKKKSKSRYSKKKSKSRYSKKKANKTKKLSIKNKNIQKGGWPFGKSSPKVTIISDEEKEEIVRLIKKIYIYYWDEILNKKIFFPAEDESIEDLENVIEPYISVVPMYNLYEKIRIPNNPQTFRETIKKHINEHIKILFSMLYEPNMKIIINNITNEDKKKIINNINNIDNIIINNININNIIEEINEKHVIKKKNYIDISSRSYNYTYTKINEENIKGIITNIIKPIIQVIIILKNKKIYENDDIPYLYSLPKHENILWEKLGIAEKEFF